MAKNTNLITDITRRVFGYKIEQNTEEVKKQTFSEPNFNDGALEVDNAIAGGFYSSASSLGYDSTPADENALITQYRDMASQPEFERAVDDVINEAFSYNDDAFPVKLILDDIEGLSDPIKNKILEEFEKIMYMLGMKNDAYEIFRRWYVDGRLYYHKVLDVENPKRGILELRYIDPRKIRKVREGTRRSDIEQGIEINKKYREFYLYHPNGVGSGTTSGLKISKDTITYVHSGLLTKDNKTVISHIHKAIRFFNSLRSIENSLVVYRLTRASEKRVFNVEVGDMPRTKAEQYIQTLISKLRKKLTFNQETGEVIENKRFTTLQEDFWFPKKDGRGTSVDILSGGANLSELDDVEYMKKKLYEALNVPYSRLEPGAGFNLGRSSEITRDELKFNNFVSRLRKRFSFLFEDILKTQLIVKKIITNEEWETIISPSIRFDYNKDSFFNELKWSEIHQNRFNALRDGLEAQEQGFISKEWLKKNILNLNEDEIEEMRKQIEKEKAEEPEDDIGDLG